MTISVEYIQTAVRELTVAEVTNLGIEVTVPVMLPNGDLLSVLVTEDSDGFLLHDDAMGASYLASIGYRIGKETRKRFAQIAARFGCAVDGERISLRCKKDQLGVAVAMVANAARAVGDLALELKVRAPYDFKQIVSDKIRELVGGRVRVNQEVHGESGRPYHVQNVILDPLQKRPIAFVESVSSKAGVAAQFAEFYDIMKATSDIDRQIFIDANSDVRESDERLLRVVSRVFEFSEVSIRKAMKDFQEVSA